MLSWSPSGMPLRYLLKKARHDRFERFNIVVSILLAGWVPSIAILFGSYTVLRPRLESKILRDRQTFVQLISRLVGDDLSRTQGIIDYYQTLPDVSRILNSSNPQSAAQQWIGTTFYSHPRIDGMFLTGRDGRLIASIPYNPAMIGKDLDSNLWRPEADKTSVAFVSPVHPRFSDKRMVTDIVGAVRTPDKNIPAISVSRSWSSESAAVFPPSNSPTNQPAKSSIKPGNRYLRTTFGRTRGHPPGRNRLCRERSAKLEMETSSSPAISIRSVQSSRPDGPL